MDRNKISSKNYFKDFEDNLLINLHKVNMRRNISQEVQIIYLKLNKKDYCFQIIIKIYLMKIMEIIQKENTFNIKLI